MAQGGADGIDKPTHSPPLSAGTRALALGSHLAGPAHDASGGEWKLICGTHNLLKLYRRALGDPAAAPYSGMATGIAC